MDLTNRNDLHIGFNEAAGYYPRKLYWKPSTVNVRYGLQ